MTKTKHKDALELLHADHKEVRKLLDELAKTTNAATKKRSELLTKIGAELRAHAKIEEEIFYPAVRSAAGTKEHEKQIAEAFEEHRAVEDLVLPDLEKTDTGTVEFGGRAKVLKELVEHHADEEEDELFETAKDVLSKEELVELGERMLARKQELLEQS